MIKWWTSASKCRSFQDERTQLYFNTAKFLLVKWIARRWKPFIKNSTFFLVTRKIRRKFRQKSHTVFKKKSFFWINWTMSGWSYTPLSGERRFLHFSLSFPCRVKFPNFSTLTLTFRQIVSLFFTTFISPSGGIFPSYLWAPRVCQKKPRKLCQLSWFPRDFLDPRYRPDTTSPLHGNQFSGFIRGVSK